MSDIIKTDGKILVQVSSKDLPKPFEKEIFLFNTHIAGTNYIENIEEIAEEMNFEDEVRFVRESKNEHDKYAICVRNKNNEKLGYIPRVDNIVFARLMDAGKLLYGKIRDVEEVNGWYKIKISIFLKNI